MIVSMLAAAMMLAQGAPAAKPEATKAADKDPMICKNEAIAGSRMPKKVCALKSEWERRREEDRMNLDKSQRAGVNRSGD